MRPKSWTLALLKPDAVANPITLKWVHEAIFHNGLEIKAGCRMRLDEQMAEKLYREHRDRFYYGRLIRHVCSGPVVVMRLELRDFNKPSTSQSFLARAFQPLLRKIRPKKVEEDAPPADAEVLQRWRRILGPSKLFANAYINELSIDESTDFHNLRQYFAVSDTRNVGHGSDSLEELTREYALFKDHLREVEYPDVELFHLDRFTLEDDEDRSQQGSE